MVAAPENPSVVAIPGDVAEWIAQHQGTRPPELRPLALAAIRRVLADKSELAELWRETDDHEWRANVESLAGLLA